MNVFPLLAAGLEVFMLHTLFFFVGFFIGLMALGVLWRSFLPFPKAGATLMVMLEGKI